MSGQDNTQIHLSPRQKDILGGLAQGKSNKQIANDFNISEATVKMHVSTLLRLFNVQNRVQVLLVAKEMGLI